MTALVSKLRVEFPSLRCGHKTEKESIFGSKCARFWGTCADHAGLLHRCSYWPFSLLILEAASELLNTVLQILKRIRYCRNPAPYS
ncbi:uncharacterized protein LOC103788657 isoform X3 [Callithrix jacchus]